MALLEAMAASQLLPSFLRKSYKNLPNPTQVAEIPRKIIEHSQNIIEHLRHAQTILEHSQNQRTSENILNKSQKTPRKSQDVLAIIDTFFVENDMIFYSSKENNTFSDKNACSAIPSIYLESSRAITWVFLLKSWFPGCTGSSGKAPASFPLNFIEILPQETW